MALSQDQITRKLKTIGPWEQDGDAIKRTFELKNFKAALNFVNKVGDKAEEADHHPDILLHGWNKVTITLSTHSEGGLTEKDFSMAEKINQQV